MLYPSQLKEIAQLCRVLDEFEAGADVAIDPPVAILDEDGNRIALINDETGGAWALEEIVADG